MKICRDPHEVTDEEFRTLKQVLDQYSRNAAPPEEMTDFDRLFVAKWASYNDAQYRSLVDSQIVELTWLITHFCLLNRWLTVLQVPDEGSEDEADFLGAYAQMVPEDIRRRNEDLLRNDF